MWRDYPLDYLLQGQLTQQGENFQPNNRRCGTLHPPPLVENQTETPLPPLVAKRTTRRRFSNLCACTKGAHAEAMH